ncbi:MAG: DUF3298 domain-containing protein [Clostridia bacterium]|nr:DUF3298 domain-containing protein [Clostridia bacterium]
MNHKQLLALFLCLVIIASSRIISIKNEVITVKDVSSNLDKFKIENIKEKDEKKSINIFYPVTEYQSVNDEILKKIEVYKNKFESSPYVSDVKKLEISFSTYEYMDYISFKFNVISNTGITHDLNEVFTVVYKNDEIIDIENLMSKDNNVLNILYNECYEKLKNNELINKYSNEEWLAKGLEKKEENYKNFVLTPNSFVVIFNEYTVAPYVAGTFEVEIEYDKLATIVD